LKKLLALIYRCTPAWVTRVLLRNVNTTFSMGAAGVFFAADGTVLVQRHVYRHQYPWGLPSGFLNAGETPEQGAVRELKEESGFDGAAEGVIGLYHIHPRHLEFAVRGTVDRTQLPRLSHEIFEIAFVAPDDLPEAMPPDQKAMVRRAMTKDKDLALRAGVH
jgi:ADP-ribose pyrophosphatase YjhB (NUDIX family)